MNQNKNNAQKDAVAENETAHMSIDECERALDDLVAELEAFSGEEPELTLKDDGIVSEDSATDKASADVSGKDGFKDLDGEKAQDDAVFAFTLTDEPAREPSDESEDDDFLSAITAFDERAIGAEYADDGELFSAAARLVVEEGVTSVSFLQRRLGIGYGKASKIVSRLEDLAIVTPMDGNLPRKVLVSPEKLEKILAAL